MADRKAGRSAASDRKKKTISARLDDVGWLLLEALQRDARASYKELGEAVGLTAPAVAERMRRMEVAGLITGYRPVIDHEALGFPILAVIRLKATGEADRKVDAVVTTLPEVLECHRVTGSESHVIRAIVRSTHHLEALLDELRPYGETITNIVTSSSVTERVVTRAGHGEPDTRS